jgi:hypothetical protein
VSDRTTEAWLDRVSRVVADPDPVRRNLGITAVYRDLGRDMHARLGGPDSNWLVFGHWASASAGRFIRGEVGPVRVGVGAVAAGNRAIIADIGPRFVSWLGGGAQRDRGLITETAELAEAFECYDEVARLPHDHGDRAQLVLRANVLVAAHEQRLADTFVDRAMPLGGLFGIITTRFVSLAIPDGDLDVCQDVPMPSYLAGRRWPAALDRLTDPRLLALARHYGQDLDDARHSNATSWETFDERMGYIFCFFRAYQQDPALRVPAGAAPA